MRLLNPVPLRLVCIARSKYRLETDRQHPPGEYKISTKDANVLVPVVWHRIPHKHILFVSFESDCAINEFNPSVQRHFRVRLSNIWYSTPWSSPAKASHYLQYAVMFDVVSVQNSAFAW